MGGSRTPPPLPLGEGSVVVPSMSPPEPEPESDADTCEDALLGDEVDARESEKAGPPAGGDLRFPRLVLAVVDDDVEISIGVD